MVVFSKHHLFTHLLLLPIDPALRLYTYPLRVVDELVKKLKLSVCPDDNRLHLGVTYQVEATLAFELLLETLIYVIIARELYAKHLLEGL